MDNSNKLIGFIFFAEDEDSGKRTYHRSGSSRHHKPKKKSRKSRSTMTSEETSDRQHPSGMVDVPSHRVGRYMEDLLDKLKLLEYENDYVDKMKMKSINRYYFQVPSSAGEKFFSFISLAAWLIRKCGKPFEQPQESDDPNSVIANIIETLKDMKADIECPPNKLKQGYGIQTINVLRFLADLALKKANFSFVRPVLFEKVEEISEADGAEIFLDKVEEEMFVSFSDDDDNDNLLLSGDLRAVSNLTHSISMKRPDKILEPNHNLDLAAWNAEVERAALSLKVAYHRETTEWRLHLYDSGKCSKEALENLTYVKDEVRALIKELDFDMEKIRSKEVHTSSRVENQLSDYKAAKEECSRLKSEYESVNGGVKERSAVLYGIQEEIEALKQEMDERGSNMTDGSPLVVMKRALSNIKNEIMLMNMRVAILEHNLLQSRIREKAQLQRALNEAQSRPSFVM